MKALGEQRTMMGHNQPPEALDDYPLTPDDISTLQSLIDDVRRETESEYPNAEQVEASASELQEVANPLGEWLKERRDEAAGAFVKVLGAALAISFIGLIIGLYNELVAAGRAIWNWLQFLL